MQLWGKELSTPDSLQLANEYADTIPKIIAEIAHVTVEELLLRFAAPSV